MSSLGGTVRRIDADRARGVIRADDQRDLAFLLADILEYDAALLAVGKRVSFTVTSGTPPRAAGIYVNRVPVSATAPAKERELRFRGFRHAEGAREYNFEWVAPGQTPRAAVVRVRLDLFLQHRVRIQDGPALCAHCVTAAPLVGTHELTDQDFRDYLARQPAAPARGGFPKRSRPAATPSNALPTGS